MRGEEKEKAIPLTQKKLTAEGWKRRRWRNRPSVAKTKQKTAKITVK